MKNKKIKFFSWENLAFHPGRFAAPIFSKKSDRDEGLETFRARAVSLGLSEGAAEAGIYPVTLPWSQDLEILADI